MLQVNNSMRQETMSLLTELRDYRMQTSETWRRPETRSRNCQLLLFTGDLLGLLGSVLNGVPVGSLSRPGLLAGDLPPELRDIADRCQANYLQAVETGNATGIDRQPSVKSG
jgi:hypothetical protein